MQKLVAVREKSMQYNCEGVRNKDKKQAGEPKRQRGQNPPRTKVLGVNIVAPSRTGLEGKGVERAWKAELLDLSMNWALVSVPKSEPHALQLDGQIRIEIELPAPLGGFSSTGTVSAIAIRPDEEKGKKTLVGIEFSETTAMDVERLAEFLRNRK
jgi:hypothetical protein